MAKITVVGDDIYFDGVLTAKIIIRESTRKDDFVATLRDLEVRPADNYRKRK